MLQHSPNYDPNVHEKLEKADWDAVLPRVLKYAISRAKKFHWLGDEVEPEALVQEAIARAYGIGIRGNYRNWDTKKNPDLADFLIGIIRSMTSHQAEHESEFPNESLFNEDGSLKDANLLKSSDKTIVLFRSKTPEEKIIEKENLKFLKDKLEILSDEDEDLGMVILCLEDGINKPREISEETGFKKEKVNNLLKRLRRKLDEYKPKMKDSLPKKGYKNEHR